MIPGIVGIAGFTGSTARASTSPVSYVVLSKSSDQVITADTKITFSGVAFGDSAMFNNANDTLTVIDGTLARLSGGFFQTNTRSLIRKGGASYPGMAEGVAQDQGRRSFGGPPLAVSGGDTFDFYTRGTSGTHAGQPWTWFALEIMDPSTKYCLVQKTGDTALADGSTTTIGWDATDVADASGMHDPSTNNTRVTVPTGVTLARPFFKLNYSGVTVDERSCWVNKNGATYNARPLVDIQDESAAILCGYGAIIPVTGGTDFFTIQTFVSGDTTLKGGAGFSYFGVECFPSNYSYCTAYKSATQALSAGVAATLLLESEVADTDGCHNTASNQGNFVCPSGKTKARLSFGIKGASTAGLTTVFAEGQLNGAHVQGLPTDGRQTDNDEALNGFGAWITVTSGDVLRVVVTSGAAQTLPASGETWVCVEWA